MLYAAMLFDTMASIVVDGISKSYRLEDESTLRVLENLDFRIPDKSFFTLVGPSGCGKSTLLDIIAGLTDPDEGSLVVENGQQDPRLGFVFQDPLLLDWKTVKENLEFALGGMGFPEREYDDRVEEALGMVGLLDFIDEYPQSLSGGMRQRVGLARAFCIDPELLLMDEPFGSLDEITARQLRSDLLEMWTDEKKTIMFVTHDIHEAAFLSDYIGILSAKPAKLKTLIEVEIPRPRDLESPELLEYEQTVLESMGLE